LLATPASDALGDVDQDCFSGCHDFFLSVAEFS